MSISFLFFQFTFPLSRINVHSNQMQSLQVSLITSLLQCVISRCIVKLQSLQSYNSSKLPLSALASTRTNLVILLLFEVLPVQNQINV